MKVLITGGAGFIGSHLAEEYLREGNEVHVIDDLSTGSFDNVKCLIDQNEERFHFTEDSILNYGTMLKLIGTCDIVIHLAAAVGVRYIIDNPLSSLKTNIHGTEYVLELCDKFKKRVLIASTSEVYGKPYRAPLRETDDCVYGPSAKSRWSYAATKLLDEFMALGYHRSKKLSVVIARLFNTVGRRQTGQYGMVVPRFVAQAIENEPITVYGDGMQTRTFTHVRDTVQALTKLVENEKANGEVVNIGGNEEVSILELARRVKTKVGSRSEIKLVPYEDAFPSDFEDVERRVPSTEKLEKLTGFLPTIGLDKILDDVIAHHRELQDASFSPAESQAD
jgi:nucleoside-diphosphate-sugar epimerase